jgi:hypothetical protein
VITELGWANRKREAFEFSVRASARDHEVKIVVIGEP